MHATRLNAADGLVATAVGLFALIEELTGGTELAERPVPALWVAGGIATAILVLFRRVAPIWTMAVYTVVSGAVFVLTLEDAAAWQWLTELVFLFTVLSQARLRSGQALFGVAATVVFVATMGLTYGGAEFAEYAIAAGMSAIAGGAGVGVRRYQVLARRAEQRTDAVVARSEQLVREAVAEEQARLARELHDIVASSVSMMVMQAGGLRRRLPAELGPERDALTQIEATGRGAVEELQRMLHLLRGPAPDSRLPQPGLARVGDLVDQSRTAGLDVTVEVTGDPRPLPAGLDLSAYRIVQEALTNTLKHAGPTRVTVTIDHGPGELRLDVTDDGPRDGFRPAPHVPGGHGLIGMRERAALFHGSLDAGPAKSGFTVRAVLPLK
ncbi:sensor histidine kinase [Herbidospora galbida]|uniref:histidine kinase n=1 Tax=Herbidospora galbida TaxID=2575442 RepID=A0A4U3MIE4_9ACTN|nr:sensor histidine kinase [Herbidospora galbida]TKK89258.1 sensor histidine kinase [Herbidospora galbida]